MFKNCTTSLPLLVLLVFVLNFEQNNAAQLQETLENIRQNGLPDVKYQTLNPFMVSKIKFLLLFSKWRVYSIEIKWFIQIKLCEVFGKDGEILQLSKSPKNHEIEGEWKNSIGKRTAEDQFGFWRQHFLNEADVVTKARMMVCFSFSFLFLHCDTLINFFFPDCFLAKCLRGVSKILQAWSWVYETRRVHIVCHSWRWWITCCWWRTMIRISRSYLNSASFKTFSLEYLIWQMISRRRAYEQNGFDWILEINYLKKPAFIFFILGQTILSGSLVFKKKNGPSYLNAYKDAREDNYKPDPCDRVYTV